MTMQSVPPSLSNSTFRQTEDLAAESSQSQRGELTERQRQHGVMGEGFGL